MGFENGFQLLFVPFYGGIIPIEEDGGLFFIHAKQIKMAQVNQSSTIKEIFSVYFLELVQYLRIKTANLPNGKLPTCRMKICQFAE